VTPAVPGGSVASPGERPSSIGAPGDQGIVAWYVEGFSDRLGDRLLLYDNTGPALELLRLAPQLAAAPGFEAALRARVDQLKAFKHPVFARVRCVTTLDDPRPQLAIVSELVPGQRLSDVLRAAEHERAKPNPGAAVWLLRQLLPGLRALHDLAPGVAHGLLGVDRIVVTPDGRLAITEYVLADGIERLGLTVADLWRHFGIAAFESPSGPTLNARSDVAGMGLLALSVLLGRQLRTDEYPANVPELLEEACSARHWMLAPMLRPWLQRALGVDAPAFETAMAAEAELEKLLPGVEGAWSRQLLPGTEQVTRLQPLERGGAASESGARALRSAREAEVYSGSRRLCERCAIGASPSLRGPSPSLPSRRTAPSVGCDAGSPCCRSWRSPKPRVSCSWSGPPCSGPSAPAASSARICILPRHQTRPNGLT
jgi:hypothetical protein